MYMEQNITGPFSDSEFEYEQMKVKTVEKARNSITYVKAMKDISTILDIKYDKELTFQDLYQNNDKFTMQFLEMILQEAPILYPDYIAARDKIFEEFKPKLIAQLLRKVSKKEMEEIALMEDPESLLEEYKNNEVVMKAIIKVKNEMGLPSVFFKSKDIDPTKVFSKDSNTLSTLRILQIKLELNGVDISKDDDFSNVYYMHYLKGNTQTKECFNFLDEAPYNAFKKEQKDTIEKAEYRFKTEREIEIEKNRQKFQDEQEKLMIEKNRLISEVEMPGNLGFIAKTIRSVKLFFFGLSPREELEILKIKKINTLEGLEMYKKASLMVGLKPYQQMQKKSKENNKQPAEPKLLKEQNISQNLPAK